MRQNETLLNTLLDNNGKLLLTDEEIGDDHISTSVDTPMRADAFELSDDEKIAQIEYHFRQIMETLGLDLTDDSLKGTPKRVAKMYVKEIFNGLNPANKPKMALFENKYKYNEMLVEKNISFYSNCEHHFVPIMGKAHIAYISNGTVVGLSKLNRLVDYFAKRPQVQERMIMQIFNITPSKQVGIIKDAIREAILDCIIPNEYDAAYQFMIAEAAKIGLHPTV